MENEDYIFYNDKVYAKRIFRDLKIYMERRTGKQYCHVDDVNADKSLPQHRRRLKYYIDEQKLMTPHKRRPYRKKEKPEV